MKNKTFKPPKSGLIYGLILKQEVEKARKIKANRQKARQNTVSKQLVELRSSPNVNRIQQYTIQMPQGAAWPPRTVVLGGLFSFH